MDDKPPGETEAPFFATQAPFRKDLRWRLARLRGFFNLHDRWWQFLDRCEASRPFRIKLYLVLAVVVGGAIGVAWYFPIWREDRSLRIARQWLEAGKLEQAERSVNLALGIAGERPEAWDLAADYARAAGRPQAALTFSRQAASMAPNDPARQLNRAGDALAAQQLGEAATAVARAMELEAPASARAERIAGEVARRRGEADAARRHFESALRVGGVLPESEIPLGLVLVTAAGTEDRARGTALLEKWAGDPAWGVEALRPLLELAVAANDAGRMRRWAEALLAHPRRGTNDLLNALLALSRVDADRFAAALATEEKSAESDPGRVTELVSWLAGMGRGAEAVRWVATLPAGVSGEPPVAVALADALRLTGDWSGLRALADRGNWEHLEFLRLAYQALAAQRLGDEARRAQVWQSVVSAAGLNGGQGAFLAGVVYSWGWKTEAVALWALAAEEPGLAINALGALARHYQVARDADGLYRTFRRLHELRAGEPGFANNYAYLAALMDRIDARADEAARNNREKFPANLDYRSTAAFLLLHTGQAREAAALLDPVAVPLAESPARCFTYGLVLAANGRMAEARGVLAKVDRAALTLRETELLDAALR
jgi:tetratricopeptide (TPR) repeat protein